MIPRLPQEIRRPDAATIALLEESRAVIAARPVDLSAAVYRHLPNFGPGIQDAMAAQMRLHGERLVHELLRAVEALGAIASLEDDLQRLGAEHAGHGVPAEHYPYLGQALVRAVRELFPASDGGALGSAWMEVYEWLAAQMLHGATEAEPSYLPPRLQGTPPTPAYWRAYVDADPPDGPGHQEPPPMDQTVLFDRTEVLERLARAEEFGASPDVRGNRALLSGEAVPPVAAGSLGQRLRASEVGEPVDPLALPPPAVAAGPEFTEPLPGRPPGVSGAGSESSAAGRQPEPTLAGPPGVGAPSPPPRRLETEPPEAESRPRPGSSSPWPYRASAPRPADETVIFPTWLGEPPRGVGTGWPPDPAIKPPRPNRPPAPDLDDAPVQE
jgi:hemoglobin-like flavoprotein